MEYRIVRAGPDDWDLLRSVRLRALADTPDAFASTLAEEQSFSEQQWRLRSSNGGVGQFLAFAADADAVGIAVGAPYREQVDTAGLFSMWVAPEVRRQNIATALIQAVIVWANNEEYRRIVLDVNNSNFPAIRLYESCGFVPNGKTRTLPPPRNHIAELQFERILD